MVITACMDEFCGSPFWNSTLTWYTTDPELTLCFEKTALVLVPSLFLWVFCALELAYFKNSKRRNVPWNWRNISKFVVLTILIGLAAADIIMALSKETVYNVDIYSPLVKLATYLLTVILLYYNKKYGLHTSGLLFISWFILAIAGIPQFRTEIRRGQSNIIPKDEIASHNIYLISYPLTILLFLLQCIADKPAKESKFMKSEKPCPEETASFLSRLTYTWFDPLVIKGYKKPLEAKDLWDMNQEDSCREVVPRFEKHWLHSLGITRSYSEPATTPQDSEVKFKSNLNRVEFTQKSAKKKQASILPAVFKTFGWTFLFATLLRVVQDIMTFINPQVLGLLISFVAQGQETWKGYLYAFLLLGTAGIQTLLGNVYVKKVFVMGMNIRSALISIIYKKALTISNSARRERTVGEIVNLMAVDSQKFMDLANHINQLWSAPLQISLSMYFLWQELGPSVLAGLVVMLILIPVNGVIGRTIKKLHVKQMKTKDARVKLMNEILNGMKVLKLYAWEPSFEAMVLKTRDREVKVLKHASYLHASTSFIWQCAPFIVSLVTFGTYVLIDEKNVLDANKAYVSLSLFNIMRMPMGMLPNLITQFIQTVVSVNRINKFMNADDVDPDNVYHEPNKEYPLTIENGTFSWGEEPILRNINMKLESKSLTAIVGSVGSGKSTLISAFLGETEKVSGRVNTYGSIAYVSQQAWIQNATLKDNILFGQVLDETLYDKVIEACALKPDLQMLPGGDQTEIGEKGINLSGGQKQRVSLARAVYANADIYLLDDPLSAVDSHVGKHIFDEVIGPKGLLRNKTKVLVTHGITYLPQTDKIIVITNGEVSESGTYKELLDKKGAFAEFLLQHINEENIDDDELIELKDQLIDTPLSQEVGRRLSRGISRTSEDSAPDVVRNGSMKRQISTVSTFGSKAGDIKGPPKGGKKGPKGGPPGKGGPGPRGHRLIELEKAEKGKVSWDVYKHYLKAIGIMMMLTTWMLNISYQAFGVGSNVWLGVWADDDKIIVNGTVDTARRDMYLGVYGALGVGQVLSVITANLLYTKASLDAAIRIHKYLLHNVLRLPMSFFDVTPLGRILGRFSNDINGVDQRLPGTIQMILNQIIRVLGTVVVICFSTPLFITVLIPISVVYILMQRLFVATSRQLKRLESVSRSPIYSHFGETVTGVQVIRAFRQQHRFIGDNESKVDLNQVCNYPTVVSGRWLSVRLEMMGNLIIFFAALFSVLRKDQAPAMVGLAITYSLQITQTLNWLVRMTSEIETNIVAVERIKEYGEAKTEADWIVDSKNPPKTWPETGTVEFKNYSVRYRPGLDLILTGIDFHIKGGEKVGIVGRTGAGKSSLTLSLFRIIEAAQGHIEIDGVNVGELGLHTLRSRLTIIPQDAVLFSGSLRMNLDPFDTYSDEDVWKALEQAHLKPFIKGLPAGLQHEVSEGGENLSVGQRQLICLARALLRKTKILVLDEATAAVDLETDDLIQTTIRTEFKDCTIITIAHRLNTIMDSDRIMVLDKGKIAEFDTPENLLADENTIFYGMHKDAGLS